MKSFICPHHPEIISTSLHCQMRKKWANILFLTCIGCKVDSTKLESVVEPKREIQRDFILIHGGKIG